MGDLPNPGLSTTKILSLSRFFGQKISILSKAEPCRSSFWKNQAIFWRRICWEFTAISPGWILFEGRPVWGSASLWCATSLWVFYILIRRQRKRCQKRIQEEVVPQESDSTTCSFLNLFHLSRTNTSLKKNVKLVVFNFPDPFSLMSPTDQV